MTVTEFVTVDSFETAPEAWVCRNRLVANGINAFVIDEHTVNMYWLCSNAIGGVKVQIPLKQIGLLRDIESQELPPVSELAIHAADSHANEPALGICPSCGSSEITNTTWSKPWTFVLWLIFGFPIPVYAPTTSCNDCGYKFWREIRMPSRSQIPMQFRIIHILFLTTVVAFVLGISIHAGFDWQNFSSIQTPSAMPK